MINPHWQELGLHDSFPTMTAFRHIGIIIKQQDERLTSTLDSLLVQLRALDVELYLDETLQHAGFPLSQLVSRAEIGSHCDLCIVVGGDGTLLGAARSLAAANVPLLGVNVGRLGFLVDVSPDELATQLKAIFGGDFQTEQRYMLRARILRDRDCLVSEHALNDVVLHVRDAIRMIEFETRIDDKLVNMQRADGIVVSTPTGSTAYALSGGGPILHPEINAMTMVPICPHTLSSRPIVISANSNISISLVRNNHSSARVAFDGQNMINVEPGDALLIDRSVNTLQLIHPSSYDYYAILRQKLKWSAQP